MKLIEIIAHAVKSVSLKELLNLHFRIHQLYSSVENRNPSPGYLRMLEEKHSILANEVARRGLNHATPLTKEEKIKLFIKI